MSASVSPGHGCKATLSTYRPPDLQHNLFLLSQENQLFLSPAGKDKTLNRVLDAGTGTGIWAIEFGASLPVDLGPQDANSP